MSLKYASNAIGFSSGFNYSGPFPGDVRQVVDTDVDRFDIRFVYPSLPVTVLNAPVVVGGVNTYPNMTHWRCLVQKSPNIGGPTTGIADWKEEKNPAGGGYKGAYNANTNAPDLRSSTAAGATLRASLTAGNYFIVSTAGTAANVDGIQVLNVRDTLFWNGTAFDRFQNTNPDVKIPLYDNTQGTDFTTEVLRLIRLNALKEWATATAYATNSFVRKTYLVGTKTVTDTYVAVADMTVAEAALPTATVPNPKWLLLTTTNNTSIAQDNTWGTEATGTFAPTTHTADKYLSIQETDARIKQHGGKQTVIDGGNALTFSTSDITEPALP